MKRQCQKARWCCLKDGHPKGCIQGDPREPKGKRLAMAGRVRWHRSKADNTGSCKCCDGPHVYSYDVEIDPDQTPRRWRMNQNGQPTDSLDIMRFVYDALTDLPEGCEVTISVEETAPPEPLADSAALLAHMRGGSYADAEASRAGHTSNREGPLSNREESE